jgi:hypothetical protein
MRMALRHHDEILRLAGELTVVDKDLAQRALVDPQVKRLMTIGGINSVVACSVLPFKPSWRVCPTDPVPVVLQTQGKRIGRMMRWDLVPYRNHGVPTGKVLINAQAEHLAADPIGLSPLPRERALRERRGSMFAHQALPVRLLARCARDVLEMTLLGFKSRGHVIKRHAIRIHARAATRTDEPHQPRHTRYHLLHGLS